MKNLKIAAIALFCGVGPIHAKGNTNPVDRITIQSRHMSTAIDPEANVAILRKGKAFHQGHRSVDPRVIAALVSAVEEPAVVGPQLQNLGVTATSLKSLREAGEPSWLGAKEKEWFDCSFADLGNVEKLLPPLFKSGATDDYGSVEVRITFADGSVASIRSDSHYEFMLPWKIERDGRTTVTYNADIARALVPLLPKKAANRERLAGERLAEDLVSEVHRDYKNADGRPCNRKAAEVRN
jgi:hypothetical protein